jgi:hypothetical protein
MPEYTYDENGWPSLPEDTSRSAYEAVIDEQKAFHNGLMDAAKAAHDETFAEPMPGSSPTTRITSLRFETWA